MHVFGTRKNVCSSKFVQLELLYRMMVKIFKKPCSLRFSLHKFVYLKLFWTQLEIVHMQGLCSIRPGHVARGLTVVIRSTIIV